MVTAAVIGLRSSIHYSNHLSEMINYSSAADLPLPHHHHHHHHPSKKIITAKKAFIFSTTFSSSSSSDNRIHQSVNALKEDLLINTAPDPSCIIEENPDPDISIEALLLLQKSLLEKQWNLSAENAINSAPVRKKAPRKIQQQVTTTCSSGTSARKRRMENRQQIRNSRNCNGHLKSIGNSDKMLHSRFKNYSKGVGHEELLTHKEVVHLSVKIKECVWLEDHKARLKQRLGCEPSDEELAASLNITRADLQSRQLEYRLAREKLAMSNVRLVMSIAQRYDNMGVEMPDLIQGGLIGLLRGIEKFDSSKGFKISTYVYWWIRQGVTRAFVDNSRTLRLPLHLHERLRLIRNAKIRLQEKGIVPSIDRIAESLNMSQKKVRNATEATSKVFSLDREAYPSINGIPGATLHNYIADDREENDLWNITEEWALKEEVNNLINSNLTEREREIIRLYYGLDNETLTWEDISKRIGLSRERVRQVGLVAIEKLKHAARRSKMEAMLVKH